MTALAPEVEVDTELEGVIGQGLRAVRGERYPSAAEFLSALEGVPLPD